MDEFYAPYRGNPEDEPRRPARESQVFEGPMQPAEESQVFEEPDPRPEPNSPLPAADWGSDHAQDDNGEGAQPDLARIEEPGPSGQVSERSEMLFLDPDDPDYDKIPPADLPRPEEYPDLTVVPLPPLAPPPAATPSDPAGSAAGAGSGRTPTEDPAGAAPALSVYPEETRSALPKNAVPGLITHPRDVALIEKLRRDIDPAGALAWESGKEISGPGLQADAEGRLSGLSLDKLGLSGRLDLSGAEGLLEFKSVGNPLTGLKMSGLPRLQSLTLSGADLTRLERGALAGLTGLVSLDLARNGLEKIDPNALSALKSLDTLSLNSNRLEQVGRGYFTGLDSVSELNLNNNHINEVKWGALAPMPGLVTLQLAGNRLTEIHGGFFPGLDNLEILHLENNRLTNLTRDALIGISSLKYVDLSNNYLQAMPTLNHLENLSEVDLTANCLPLGAIKEILDSAPENARLHLRGQTKVYFGLRVQLLPGQDHFLIPASDAFIDEVPSHGRILGPDPAGASYSPPEAPGQPGRLTFHRPGLYTLLLINSGLGNDPDLSTATGEFLVVDSYPEIEQAVKRLGHRDLATGLVRALTSRGFVEAPAANPKRITALRAIFGRPPDQAQPGPSGPVE